MTDPFEMYKLYLAIRNHFTQASYDFFKYNGNVPASKDKFMTRKDRFFFHKLGKKTDPRGFLVANFVYREKQYLGDMLDDKGDEVHRQWQKNVQSLSYMFTNDLDKIDDLKSSMKTTGQHPELLTLSLQGDIMMETLMILNQCLRSQMFKFWDQTIVDPVIWPQKKMMMNKYQPFVINDVTKYKLMLVNKYNFIL